MNNRMRLIGIAIAIVLVAVIGPLDGRAGFGHHGPSHGCCQCPNCDYVCKLKAELVDEEKTCFDVETKVICIPRVVFPWQKKCDPCANNGARLRTVCVVTTDKYKCPKCEYTWKAEKRPNPCAEMIGGSDLEVPRPAPLPAPSIDTDVTSPSGQAGPLVPAVDASEIDPLAYGIPDPQRQAPVTLERR